jgi:hypothetical protein
MGCGGTHGEIINYCYDVNHDVLDSALQTVLHNNEDIRRDTGSHDGYNNGEYFVLFVDMPNGTYQYNFRYFGDSTLWQQDSLKSCLFIWAMYNSKNEGGWDKDFGFSEKGLRNELLKIVQEKVIERVDKVIGVQHSVGE